MQQGKVCTNPEIPPHLRFWGSSVGLHFQDFASILYGYPLHMCLPSVYSSETIVFTKKKNALALPKHRAGGWNSASLRVPHSLGSKKECEVTAWIGIFISMFKEGKSSAALQNGSQLSQIKYFSLCSSI